MERERMWRVESGEWNIHNIEYQGKFHVDSLEDLFGISREYLPLMEFDGCINLMKGA
ncbi:MAG: glycogen/starch synthase, partial [Oscillospiraceae bacterium]|nr:glycogen/starch synthase [Oscillospiraceae bacterium]